MDVDEAYEKIGEYGKLQVKLFWSLAVFNIFQAFHQVHMLYMGAVPHFKCISKHGKEFDGCANGTTCNSYWYSNEFTSVVTEVGLKIQYLPKLGKTNSGCKITLKTH